MDNGILAIIVVVLISTSIMIFVLWKNSRRMDEDIRRTAQQRDLVRHDERALMLCRAVRILNPNVIAGVDYLIKQDAPDQDPYIGEWLADTARPTDEELGEALREVSDAHHEEKYAAMRRADYPSVEEQLNAAYQTRQGDDTKQREVDERIRRVKEHYPKGNECV